MTPRKQRPHRRQASNSQLAQPVFPSDYDSEATPAPFVPPTQPTTRTTYEMNMSVLQRYNPSITSIDAIASSCQIYHFSDNEGTWEKAEVEGTLFVCQFTAYSPDSVQGVSVGGGAEGYCLMLLNRKAMDELNINMEDILNIEFNGQIMILQFKDTKGSGLGEKILGFFIHAEQTREDIVKLIKGYWARVQEAKGDELEKTGEWLQRDEGEGEDFKGKGRRISMSELWGKT